MVKVNTTCYRVDLHSNTPVGKIISGYTIISISYFQLRIRYHKQINRFNIPFKHGSVMCLLGDKKRGFVTPMTDYVTTVTRKQVVTTMTDYVTTVT